MLTLKDISVAWNSLLKHQESHVDFNRHESEIIAVFRNARDAERFSGALFQAFGIKNNENKPRDVSTRSKSEGQVFVFTFENNDSAILADVESIQPFTTLLKQWYQGKLVDGVTDVANDDSRASLEDEQRLVTSLPPFSSPKRSGKVTFSPDTKEIPHSSKFGKLPFHNAKRSRFPLTVLYGAKTGLENIFYIKYFTTEILPINLTVPEIVETVASYKIVPIMVHLSVNLVAASYLTNPSCGKAAINSAGFAADYLVQSSIVEFNAQQAVQPISSIFDFIECGKQMLMAGVGAVAMSSTNIAFGGIFNPWQVSAHTTVSTIFTGIKCYTQSYNSDTEPGYLKQAIPYVVDAVVVVHSLSNPAQTPDHMPKLVHVVNVATETLRSVVVADQMTKLGMDLVGSDLIGHTSIDHLE